ncbi:MAG TPA: serine kinase [Deltaproteobacteria bacterium]|nr:serine kinase [Deltaproteobacteria bacterium]HPR55488.1 serine kinase [Deltaproteobacteria bacterium]HXK47500.1 serine kinase [Deltaproteobacteria bacterium]
MMLETVSERLSLKCKCCWENLKREVTGGYAGDLLSDVMANSSAGNIWVTRQVHQNIVAVAALKEHAAIVIVQGATPEKETLDKATKEGIPILVADMGEFEVVGRLHRLLYPDQG